MDQEKENPSIQHMILIGYISLDNFNIVATHRLFRFSTQRRKIDRNGNPSSIHDSGAFHPYFYSFSTCCNSMVVPNLVASSSQEWAL